MTRPPKSRMRPDRRPAYGRRTPPPERTGLEAAFLGRIVDTQELLKIRFRDGETIEGTIESFDRDTVVIRLKHGPAVVYRKSEIRCFEE